MRSNCRKVTLKGVNLGEIEVYDFDDIFTSIDKFNTVKEKLKSELNENFLSRRDPVRFLLDGKEFDVTKGRVFLNLCLMKAFITLGIHPNESDIFSAESVTQGELEDYANHIIERAKELNKAEKIEVNYDLLRQSIADDNDELCDLSERYNKVRGNSISFRDFIRLEVEDPEAYALFHPVVKPGQFNAIEAQFKIAGKKLEEYFITHKDTELHPFVASETGVNIKQFTQMAAFVGLKPDRDGRCNSSYNY